MLRDALDCAVFPRRVPALEYDQNLVATLDEVPLQFYKLNLKFVQRIVVVFFGDLG